jgi:hypothetical protein
MGLYGDPVANFKFGHTLAEGSNLARIFVSKNEFTVRGVIWPALSPNPGVCTANSTGFYPNKHFASVRFRHWIIVN